MFETMRLEELKGILESKTLLEYEIKGEEIYVKGLKKGYEIYIRFGRFNTTDDNNGKRFAGVSYSKNFGNHAGGGGGHLTIDGVIKMIRRAFKTYGFEWPEERITQLSLF